VVLEGGSPVAPPPPPPASPGCEPINARAFRYLYETVCADNAREFLTRFAPDLDAHRDLVIVHDPQPAGMITALKAAHPSLKTIWRAHIGLDSETPTTRAAWGFLRPYVEQYSAAVFSAAEYIPSWLRARAFVVHPGVSPLAPKNREMVRASSQHAWSQPCAHRSECTHACVRAAPSRVERTLGSLTCLVARPELTAA